METYQTILTARDAIQQARFAGFKIGFVATMGNLHEGHMALVNQAKKISDFVVVSIFVNPTQFIAGEDFSSYPRTFEEDTKKLEETDVDLLFHPDADEIYPLQGENMVQLSVPDISDILCGATRPGHFQGVAQVVAKLFNIIQPDVALFGEKDYQQCLVIKALVNDLNFPVSIELVPTTRESDGLAMSSRNQYLTNSERLDSTRLHQLLSDMKNAIQSGERNFQKIIKQGEMILAAVGFIPDYLTIRKPDLSTAKPDDDEFVILVAAKLGKARLIDNISFSINSDD
jgi:pantoate--beta-alanine ligase